MARQRQRAQYPHQAQGHQPAFPNGRQPTPPQSGAKKKRRGCCGCLGVGFLILLLIGGITSLFQTTAEDSAASPVTSSTPTPSAPEPTETGDAEPSSSPSSSSPSPSASPTPSPSPSATPTTSSPSPSPTEDDEETTNVTRVIDGDTVVVTGGDRVRLLGIDTPEVGECHADTATQRMVEMVEGKEVTLIRDDDDADHYGRLLRYIDVNGVDAGYTLIAEGLAVSRYDSRDGYGFHTREPDYIDADNATTTQTCAPTPEPEEAPEPPQGDNCDPNYTPCIPVYPPDINCSDIDFSVRVITGDDPHNLDADGDGVGCEGNG